jgi:cytochrome c-type biogenesis protein CcmH/NrfG
MQQQFTACSQAINAYTTAATANPDKPRVIPSTGTAAPFMNSAHVFEVHQAA